MKKIEKESNEKFKCEGVCKWKLSNIIENKNAKISWKSKGEYGIWLPFENQKELNEAINWLNKWAFHYCYRFSVEGDKYIKEQLEYIPLDVSYIIQDKICEDDKNTIGIRMYIGRVLI